MSNVPNWASAMVIAGLILLTPIMGLVVVAAVDMLGDLVAQAGATVIWPVVTGDMAWLLLRKLAGQPRAPRLQAEGA
jgi:uncharacterized protein YhdP